MSDGLSHVSVTPTMSRSFDKTKSLNADVLFYAMLDQEFPIEAFHCLQWPLIHGLEV